jgi:rRNA-processing protein FCF1
MKKVIIDSSFILTCVKQKIDFFKWLEERGIQILIPKQVIDEIKNIENSKKKLHFKNDAELSLFIIEKNKKNFKEIDLKWKNVDNALVKFAEKNKEIIIATLDREIKSKIKNKKLLIKGKKMLEIE